MSRRRVGATPSGLPEGEALERHAWVDDRPGGEAVSQGRRQESRLCYLGHALMENRNGLAVGGEVTHATGRAEREAAFEFSAGLPEGATVGADKGYDAERFVEGLKARLCPMWRSSGR